MFLRRGNVLLFCLSCFVWSLVNCDEACVPVQNGDSYIFNHADTNSTSREFNVYETNGKTTTILVCNITFPNCYIQNNLNNRFYLIPSSPISLNVTVWTALINITVVVRGLYNYTNVTCFSVTAKPTSFSCGNPNFYDNYSPPFVRLDCTAINGYLPNSRTSCSLYKRDSNQSLNVATNVQANPSVVAEWYNYTCSLFLYSLEPGANKLTASFNNNSLVLLNYIVPEFTYTELNIYKWTSRAAYLGTNVSLTCETRYIPAQRIRISRKWLKQELNETTDSRILLYTIANFSCDDVDEYECTISNSTDQKSLTIPLIITCPPRIISSSQQNKVFTAKPGGSVLISTDIFTPSGTNLNCRLYFEESGQIFLARPSQYSVNFNPYSVYYCSLNLALFDLTDSDFRNYFLSVKSNNLEDFANFTLSIDSSDSTKDALIGVAVVAGVLFIAVLILVVVVIFLRRSRQGIKMVHQPVQRTEVYDGVNQAENYGHDYGETQVKRPKVVDAPKLADEDEKYEPVTNQQSQHATATKPPSAAGHGKPTLAPPQARPKLPPPEETYEMTTNGPTEHYGNFDGQPVYGNLRDSS